MTTRATSKPSTTKTAAKPKPKAAVASKAKPAAKPKAAAASSKAKPAAKSKAAAAVNNDEQDGLTAALRALAFALDKKGLEPVLLDVRSLCSYCNFQLVLSGRSERQVEAISDGIRVGMRDHAADSLRPIGSEGARAGQWSLLDYGDFIVHVFSHAVREHYDLEGLWSDAPRIAIDVPADARIAPGDYA